MSVTERRLELLATPSHALVEMSPDATLVHERGVVILANRVAARLVGAATPEELVGRDVASYLCGVPPCFGDALSEMRACDGNRFPVWVREVPLALGGRVRRALLLREAQPGLRREPAAACPAVERALAALQALLASAACPTMVLDTEAHVLGDPELLEQLTCVLVLDALAALDPRHAAENHISITLVCEGSWVILDVIARPAIGSLVTPTPGSDSFGVTIARQHVDRLGAELRVDRSDPTRRRLLVTLLRAEPPQAPR